MKRHVCAIGIVAMLTILGFSAAEGQENAPRSDLKAEFFHDFRKDRVPDKNFTLFGPDAAQRVKSEPDGLRIILSGEQQNPELVGVAASFNIQGDFDIATSFEISNANPGKVASVSFEMYLRTTSPKGTALAFYYEVSPNGNATYIAVRLTTNDTGKREGVRSKRIPAAGKSGLMRVSRSGSEVVLSVADDADKMYRELARYDLGRENVSLLRLAAHPSNPSNVLDLRLLDLRVRAAGLPNLSDNPKGMPSVVTHQAKGETATRTSLVIAVLLVLTVVALSVGLLLLRRRHAKSLPAEAVEPVQESQLIGLRKSRYLYLMIPVILVGAGIGVVIWFADFNGTSSQKDAAEFYEDFRNKKIDELQAKPSFQGAAQFMKSEPEGLRITLTADQGKHVETGVLAPVVVQGDFEITAGYEILQAQQGRRATFEIYLVTKTPTNEALAIHRYIDSGSSFFGNRMTTNAQGKRENVAGLSIGNSPYRATSKSGQLRIARQGTEAILSFADPGQKFQELFRAPLGPEEIAKVRVAVNPRNAEFVDVRLTDLRVKGNLTTMVKAAPPRGSWMWLVIGFFASLFLIAGLWFLVRKAGIKKISGGSERKNVSQISPITQIGKS